MTFKPEFYVNGKPARVVYDGETKITLIGRWFFMTPEEVGEDYRKRVEAGEPICTEIHDELCRQIIEEQLQNMKKRNEDGCE